MKSQLWLVIKYDEISMSFLIKIKSAMDRHKSTPSDSTAWFQSAYFSLSMHPTIQRQQDDLGLSLLTCADLQEYGKTIECVQSDRVDSLFSKKHSLSYCCCTFRSLHGMFLHLQISLKVIVPIPYLVKHTLLRIVVLYFQIYA